MIKSEVHSHYTKERMFIKSLKSAWKDIDITTNTEDKIAGIYESCLVEMFGEYGMELIVDYTLDTITEEELFNELGI